jgi:hypothetical protein
MNSITSMKTSDSKCQISLTYRNLSITGNKNYRENKFQNTKTKRQTASVGGGAGEPAVRETGGLSHRIAYSMRETRNVNNCQK